MSDTPDPDVQTNPITGQPITPPGPQPTGPKGNPPPVIPADDPDPGLGFKQDIERMEQENIDKAPATSPKIKMVPLPEPSDAQIKELYDRGGIVG